MDALRLEALDAIVDPFCQAIRAGSHVFIVFHFAAAPAELLPQVTRPLDNLRQSQIRQSNLDLVSRVARRVTGYCSE